MISTGALAMRGIKLQITITIVAILFLLMSIHPALCASLTKDSVENLRLKWFEELWAFGVDWSPDGSEIAVTREAEHIEVRDVNNGNLKRIIHPGYYDFDVRGGPARIEISQNGSWIAGYRYGETLIIHDYELPPEVSQSRAVIIWDFRTGEKVTDFTFNNSIGSFEWSPDGSMFAVGNFWTDKRVGNISNFTSVVDSSSGQILYSFPSSSSIYDLDWSPDSNRIVVSNEEGKVKILNLNDGSITSLDVEWKGSTWLNNNSRIRVDWANDNNRIALSVYDRIIIFDVSEHKTIETISGPYVHKVNEIEWSPDGTTLLSVGLDGNTYSMKFWDKDGKLFHELDCTNDLLDPVDLVWSPAGEMIALAGDNGIGVWGGGIPIEIFLSLFIFITLIFIAVVLYIKISSKKKHS